MAMNIEEIGAAANLSAEELAAFATLGQRDMRDIEVLAEHDPAGALLAAQGLVESSQDADESAAYAVFVKVVNVLSTVGGVASALGSVIGVIRGL